MIRYATKQFDVSNKDVLWEKFRCFAQTLIPYEEHWDGLTESQKYPLTVFIYAEEVLREAHMGFLDLHQEYISLDDVIKAMEVLQISNPYIENIRKIPLKQVSLDDLIEQSADEDEFAAKMDELDEMLEVHDKRFCELVRESSEIEDKILAYVRANLDLFFQ